MLQIYKTTAIKSPECGDNANRVEIEGESMCVCNEGYQGDGIICTGK